MADDAELLLPESTGLQYLHLCHCAFAVSDGSALLLIDPFLSGQFNWRNKVETHLDSPAFEVHQINNCQAILISHEHEDHYDSDTLAVLLSQTDATVYAPQQVVELADEDGLDTKRFVTIHRLDRFKVGEMQVTVYPAAKSETVHPVDRVGFLIESGDVSLYHQGDSHGWSPAWNPMKGKVDAIIMWPHRVLEIVKPLRPKAIIFHHLDLFTPGDFFCNRSGGLELAYHRYYHPEVQFVVPDRGVWLNVPRGLADPSKAQPSGY